MLWADEGFQVQLLEHMWLAILDARAFRTSGAMVATTDDGSRLLIADGSLVIAVRADAPVRDLVESYWRGEVRTFASLLALLVDGPPPTDLTRPADADSAPEVASAEIPF